MQNQKQTSNKSRAASPVAVFFIVLFVLVALVVAFFAFDFFSTDSRGSMNYVIGEAEYKLSGDKAYSDNGYMLVCFDDIATLCGMTVTGSASSKTYYAEGSEQKIELTEGDRTARINSAEYDMLTAAILRDGKMYVPLDFVRANMYGIELLLENSTLTVKRGEYNASTKKNPIYEEVTFAGGIDTEVGTPDDTSKVAPKYDFVADLSDYEQYMCPEDTDAFLILVNRQNTINGEYVPENLVPISNVRQDGRSESMVETAEKALQALYIEMRAAGYTDVSVTSGYRSYNKQVSLYNTYTQREMSEGGISREEAEKIVDTYSARPGTSEHQTGLCCDMHNLGSASQRFAEEEAYTWLINNCYKFGFVLRFPKGKEDITGYSFEPWHYRFVGRYHASEMHRLDMCLEEYVDYLESAQ